MDCYNGVVTAILSGNIYVAFVSLFGFELLTMKRYSSFISAFVPWIAIGIAFSISPSYMAPFMSDPIGIACLLLMLVWTIAGIALSVIPRIPGLIKGLWWIWLPVFLLVPMLGPAVITILHALGPLTGGV